MLETITSALNPWKSPCTFYAVGSAVSLAVFRRSEAKAEECLKEALKQRLKKKKEENVQLSSEKKMAILDEARNDHEKNCDKCYSLSGKIAACLFSIFVIGFVVSTYRYWTSPPQSRFKLIE